MASGTAGRTAGYMSRRFLASGRPAFPFWGYSEAGEAAPTGRPWALFNVGGPAPPRPQAAAAAAGTAACKRRTLAVNEPYGRRADPWGVTYILKLADGQAA
jgi:hypothetical protein